MNESELQSKHLAELHELAASAGIERYRMLSRAELIEKLANGQPRKDPPPRPKRERRPREGRGGRKAEPRKATPEKATAEKAATGPATDEPAAAEPPAAEPPPVSTRAGGERPKRKRRRRWGRRRKGVRVHDLLLPAAAGRQAIVYAESAAACTALLREIAAELCKESNGPDPIAVLVDPSPEELAEWKREAPEAEIVSAGKASHAEDAIAQAQRRAGGGEDVIVLVDSLSRFATAFAGVEEARELFDAGLGSGGSGTLTVVAAVERPS